LLITKTREEFMAAKLDLEELDLEDLKTLSKDIERAIKKRETDNLKKAREAAEAAAKEYGFSLDELTGAKTPRRSAEKSNAKCCACAFRDRTGLVASANHASIRGRAGRGRAEALAERHCPVRRATSAASHKSEKDSKIIGEKSLIIMTAKIRIWLDLRLSGAHPELTRLEDAMRHTCHSQRRAAQRGVTNRFVNAILAHADVDRPIGGNCRLLRVSRQRSTTLNIDDRLGRYALIWSDTTAQIVTVNAETPPKP
jgi:DNA-binding protein H-NS